MPEPRHVIRIEPARVAKILGVLAATLVLLHLATLVFRFGLGYGRVLGFVPEFNINRENNVPTYFSSFLLLICASLLAVIASWKHKSKGKFRRHWAVLAAIFLFMSLDETASLHEHLGSLLVENDLRMGGWFYFAWVVPGLILVGVFALAYLRFFLHLGKRFKRLFLASAGLYLGGALGMEMTGARYTETLGYSSAIVQLTQAVEESLELFGAVLFIYALLSYIDMHFPEVRLQTREPQERQDTWTLQELQEAQPPDERDGQTPREKEVRKAP